MRFSIIIPTYNRLEILKRCIKALENQTLDKKKYEIIIVNDGSTDGTADFLADYRTKSILNCTILHQDNLGQGVARNHGIDASHGDVVLFLGDDIIANPNLIAEHDKFHVLHPQENAAVLGFVTWDPAGPITPLMRFMEKGKAAFGRFGGHQFAYDLLANKEKADYRFFYTANISLKRSLLKREKFDTTFKAYGWEDIELGIRLAEKEKLTLYYAPNAKAFHDHFISFEDFAERMRQIGRSVHVMHERYPSYGFSPSFFKKTFFRLISAGPVLILWKIFYPVMYFYALSKKYFLEGFSAPH